MLVKNFYNYVYKNAQHNHTMKTQSDKKTQTNR